MRHHYDILLVMSTIHSRLLRLYATAVGEKAINIHTNSLGLTVTKVDWRLCPS